MCTLCENMVDIILEDYTERKSIEFEGEEHIRIWDEYIKINDPIENLLTWVMKLLFAEQSKVVLANLLAQGKIIKAANENEFFDKAEWDKKFAFEMKPELEAALIAQGYDAMQEVSSQVFVGISFAVDSPDITEWLNTSSFEYAKEINDTTIRELRKTLLDGLEDNETVNELAGRVQHIYNMADKNRALMIARTELTAASSFGREISYQQSNVVWGTEWIASLDNRVRDSHARIHGTIAKRGQRFTNGLLYPGDTSTGNAADFVNCRCTRIAVLKNDSRVPETDREEL